MVITGVSNSRGSSLVGSAATAPALCENTHCIRAMTGRMRTRWRKVKLSPPMDTAWRGMLILPPALALMRLYAVAKSTKLAQLVTGPC